MIFRIFCLWVKKLAHALIGYFRVGDPKNNIQIYIVVQQKTMYTIIIKVFNYVLRNLNALTNNTN